MNSRTHFVLATCALTLLAVGNTYGQATAPEGACYTTTGGNSEAQLVRVDLTTGIGTLVGGTGVSNGMPSLAIDSQGRIFAGGRGQGTNPNTNLYQLDAVTGTASLVGDMGDDMSGMAFDSSDRLVGASSGSGIAYFEINPADASITKLSDMDGNVAGLAFNSSNVLFATSGGAYFGSGINVDEIGTVDPLSGAETVLGSLETGVRGTPDVAFDADGNLFVTKGPGDGTVGGGFQIYSVDQGSWAATALPNSIGYSASGFACDTRTVAEAPPVDERVYVCHVAGKKGKTKTLHVDATSLQDHLDHGDTAGECVEADVADEGNGKGKKSGKFDASSTVPDSYGLSQNYPNPFNPTTTISFALPEAASVRLAVYNAVGQEVKVLVSSTLEAGTHAATWKATDRTGQRVATGMYIYRLTAGNHVETRKMILLE